MECVFCNKEYRKLGNHIRHSHPETSLKDYYDRFLKKPGEGYCLECGKSTNFKNSLTKGYYTFCSSSCANRNELTRQKIKEQSLEKYGVPHPKQSKIVQDRYKATCLERYGVKCNLQSEDGKKQIKETLIKKYGVEHPMYSDEIKSKLKETCLERYGVRCVFQNEEIKENIKKTNLEKYGTISPIQNSIIKDKIKRTNLKKYGVECVLQSSQIKEKIKNTISLRINIKNYTTRQKLIKEFGHGWYQYLDYPKIVINRNYLIPNSYIPIIKEYFENTLSYFEFSILSFIKSIYQGNIKKDRKVISPLEIDIYIPEERVGIECNGYWYHSTENIDEDYHLNKTILAEQTGIKLIHIYQWEWENKQEVCKSIIKKALKLNKIANLEDCVVKEIDYITYKEFFNRHSLSNHINKKYNKIIGIYYRSKLIQTIIFIDNKIELIEHTEYSIKDNVSLLNSLLKDNVEYYLETDRSKYSINNFIKADWSIFNYTSPKQNNR